jgi:hypothetical protein
LSPFSRLISQFVHPLAFYRNILTVQMRKTHNFLSYNGFIDNKRVYRGLSFALSRPQMLRLCNLLAHMRHSNESTVEGAFSTDGRHNRLYYRLAR